MPENIRSIIYRFSQELRHILGDKLTKVIVYGSYARGDFQENSDIDIMILVKMSDEEIRLVKNDIYDLAFEFEINTGIEISPGVSGREIFKGFLFLCLGFLSLGCGMEKECPAVCHTIGKREIG